jgi:hypothetical protein
MSCISTRIRSDPAVLSSLPQPTAADPNTTRMLVHSHFTIGRSEL